MEGGKDGWPAGQVNAKHFPLRRRRRRLNGHLRFWHWSFTVCFTAWTSGRVSGDKMLLMLMPSTA